MTRFRWLSAVLVVLGGFAMALPVPSRSFAADSVVAARLGKDPRAGAEARKGDGVSPLREAKSALVDFRSAPFPYLGIIPDKDIPFLDVSDGPRRGHTSGRGGVYWLDETYSDRRSLIYLPAGFDLRRPAVIVVFFHGNNATLSRDVAGRQRVPAQLAASGLNAVLVAPQFAVDALDSSAGNFWTPGAFDRFLREAAGRIAEVYGVPDERLAFERLPVVIVAYSGGYDPAAYAVALGGADRRIRGLILLDGLYDEEDKVADWIAHYRKTIFFFSAFSPSSAGSNQTLQGLLGARHVTYGSGLPNRLTPGTVAFFATDPDTDHDEFVTQAWVPNPLAWVLARIPGYKR